MKYQELVDVYSNLEATTKRLEKTEIISNYLKTLDKINHRRSSLLLFVAVGYLLLGRVALQVVSIFGVWLVISLFPKFKTK